VETIQGVKNPTGNGLLWSPKWFAKYDFQIHKFSEVETRQGVENPTGNGLLWSPKGFVEYDLLAPMLSM